MKTIAFNIAKFIVSIALAAWVLSMVGFSSVYQHITGIGWVAFTSATLILVLHVVVVAPRWAEILRSYSVEVFAHRLVPVVLFTHFLNQSLPFGIAGEVARSWQLLQAGVAKSAAIRSVILDRLFGLVALVVPLVIGLPFFALQTNNAAISAGLAALLVASGLAFVVIGLFCPVRSPSTLKAILWSVLLYNEMGALLRTSRTAFHIVALSVLGQLLPILACVMFSLSIAPSVPWIALLVVVPVSLLASLLPVSWAGWGIRELTFVELLSSLGCDSGEAFAISVLLGLALTVSGLLAGALYFTIPARLRAISLIKSGPAAGSPASIGTI
ncbi:MAG: flippase-like domain-containing protein [Alphaproteobacteria bacterium]|nr:flippase-like domain-containing protein [Alphaproteobacteria bacterium]